MLGRAGLYDPSLSQKHKPIGDTAGKSELMSNDDQIPPVLAQLLDHIEHFGGHFRIKR